MATHSKKFKQVKQFYNTIINGKRLWSIEQVHAAVPSWITAEEYTEITGEDYVPVNEED